MNDQDLLNVEIIVINDKIYCMWIITLIHSIHNQSDNQPHDISHVHP